MKIQFKAHQIIDQEVELSSEDLKTIFEAMKQSFLENVEFRSFDGYSHYSTHIEKMIRLCKAHNVDVSHKKDRLSFFTEIVKNLECPYD